MKCDGFGGCHFTLVAGKVLPRCCKTFGTYPTAAVES